MTVDPLRVVPLSVMHAHELFAPLREPALYRYIPGGPRQSVDDLALEFERLLRGSPTPQETWLNWVLYVGDKPAATLQATLREGDEAIIGYVIFVAFWRQGVGTRGVGWLVNHLFARGTKRLSAYVDPHNAASIRLLTRLGFRSHVGAREAEEDYVFSLTRGDPRNVDPR